MPVMYPTKLELEVLTDGVDTMRFIAEWDANFTLIIRRRGDAAFDVNLADFDKMVRLVDAWLKSVKENDKLLRS